MMKATVLTESSILYFIFSPGYLCCSDIYGCESGRCHTLPFFLTFSIISSFQVFLLYFHLSVLTESSILYFIFLPGYLYCSDIYGCESGRCRTLPFFLTFSIISSFQVFHLYFHPGNFSHMVHLISYLQS